MSPTPSLALISCPSVTGGSEGEAGAGDPWHEGCPRAALFVLAQAGRQCPTGAGLRGEVM